MSSLDKWTEYATRGIARRSSRRGWLRGLAGTLAGAATLPLLPVARANAAAAQPGGGESGAAAKVPETGDPLSLRLLALLRHRRFSVQLLRRFARQLPARHRDVAHHLDRHLPQPRRRQELRHLVQRLLRPHRLRSMPVYPQRRRPRRCTAPTRTTTSTGAWVRNRRSTTAPPR